MAEMTPAQETKLNVATTWVPVTLVVSIVGLAIWAALALSGERAAIYKQIDQVSANVNNLASTVQRLTEAIGRPDSSGMSRDQWIMDCLRLQIANPTWTCIYGPTSTHAKGPS